MAVLPGDLRGAAGLVRLFVGIFVAGLVDGAGERRISVNQEGPFLLAVRRGRGLSPCVVSGVVSQAPIRRLAGVMAGAREVYEWPQPEAGTHGSTFRG